jgi:tRNA (pseudouridine54-N1)-methyltransferase
LQRVFILKASEGRTAPDFSLKSLAGSPGRMDLLSRCVIAAFSTPRGTRRDTTLEIVLEGMPNPPIAMTIDGTELVELPAAEVAVATLIHDSLSGKDVPGIRLRRKPFTESVRRYANEGFTLYYLHEEGHESKGVRYAGKPAFILGDHKGLDPASERFLDAMGAERISLGPHSYLASHCITMVNCELDMVNR